MESGTKQILNLIVQDWKLIVLLTVLFSFYFYYTCTFDHFKNLGIPYKKPVILFGNLWPRIKADESFHQFQLNIYNNFKGIQYAGTFEGRRPILNIIDSDLIKAITIRDFDYFVDRNSLRSRNPRYVTQSLLNLKGSEWKGVRSTLTPAFSSSRLKHMLPLIQLCSQQMVKYIQQFDGKDVEMKQKMGHFTLEVIGACAFGIKCDALTNDNAHFLKIAEKFDYMPTLKRMMLFFLLLFMPNLIKYIRFSFLNDESTGELMRMLKKAKDERRLADDRKNDFLQIMLDFAKKEKASDQTSEKYLDDDTIDAQCLLFLIAGYETSSTLLSFALYVLATDLEIQEKLRAHVKEKTDGKEITYELLSQLTYLEGFLLETLRVYPPVARVDRVCTKQYNLPGTSIHVKPGEVVAIPIYGIHMDPDYYPNPQEFRPERFMDEEKKERPSHLFLAFGAGPRNCIGLRFAMFSAKMAMVALIKNFKFSACPKTQVPLQFDKRAILLKPASGLWIRVEKI